MCLNLYLCVFSLSLSHPCKIKFHFEFLCRSCLSVCLCLPLCLSVVCLCLSFFRLIFVAGAAVCTAVSQVSHFRCYARSALSKTQVINSPRKCHLSFRRRRKSLSVIRPGLCRGFTPSFTPSPPPPPHLIFFPTRLQLSSPNRRRQPSVALLSPFVRKMTLPATSLGRSGLVNFTTTFFLPPPHTGSNMRLPPHPPPPLPPPPQKRAKEKKGWGKKAEKKREKKQ